MPTRLSRTLTERVDDRHRDRIAAALGVLVKIKRQRRARRRRSREMPHQLLGVKREIRRRDHRDRRCADLGSMSGEPARLSRGLRAAVHNHRQTPGAGDRQLGNATSLPILKQDPLAGRAEHQQPVKPARAVEIKHRRERVLVKPPAPIAQRRHRRGERPGDPRLNHRPMVS